MPTLLINHLKQFGLDEKQAKVYVALLELGMAKANDLAQKAGLERPTVYDVLNKLAKGGLVSLFNKRGVRYYVAEDPLTIKKQLAEKQTAFEELLPEIRSIQNTLETKPAIRYYEGIAGIKKILEDTLTARNKQLRGILSVIDLFKVPGRQFMERYVADRIKADINLRVLRSRPREALREYWPTSRRELRELRYTPTPMVFAMTIYIYDDKVSLISSSKENFGMIIESDEFAKSMGHLFEALWQISKPDLGSHS